MSARAATRAREKVRASAASRLAAVDVDVAGREDGQPIVLLHGIGVTRKQWLPQMRDLVDEFRLIAPDLPGHGTLKERGFTLDAAATHAAAVIDAYADGRALVVGLSLGGYVAMRLAARSPEKVAGLVLTGCSGNPKGVLGVIPASMALFCRAVGGRCALPHAIRRRAREAADRGRVLL
jgi:pimeloyl-ACP methyl ester carboxylesterase